MELRNREELRNFISDLYNNADHTELRRLVNNPYVETINYNENTQAAHIINLYYPGKKTFEKNVRNSQGKWEKTFSAEVISHDIKIEVIYRENHVFTHADIVEDLYWRVYSEDPVERQNNYNLYLQLLSNLYLDVNPLLDLKINQTDLEMQPCLNGQYNTLALINFIKWCAVQEEINYPPTRGYGGRWGKDLSFARYFEAIWAAYTGDYKLKDILTRTRQYIPKPVLFENDDIYSNFLNHRY